ncbi:MAG: N-6 DNA methylase [Pseudonocardia sp.]|nr:N-6 DNA methylase [Pseudonocardia sp.]
MTEHRRVTAAEIARRCGVGLPAVSNWRDRHSDFPAGLPGPSGETFAAGEVLTWLRGRAVPSTRLRPGEPPGMSYAERFGGTGNAVAQPAAGRIPERQSDKLWVARELQCNGAPPEPIAEMLMGLVALRLRTPDAFAALHAADPRNQTTRLATLPAAEFAGLFPEPDRGFFDVASLGRAIDAVARMALPAPDDRVARGRFALQLIEVRAAALGRAGDHITPAGLVDLMVGVTRAGSAANVHDPFVRGGELLIGAAMEHAVDDHVLPQFSAVSPMEGACRSTRAALLIAGVDGDVWREPMLSVRDDAAFDVVLANPPYGLSLTDVPPDDRRWRYGSPERSGNYAWLQHVIALLGPDGRAAVLMPNYAGTSNRPLERSIRAAMLDDGVVDAIVALPDRLFPSTPIAPSLWLLRHPPGGPAPDVLLVDATGLGRIERRSRVLTADDIARIRDACVGSGEAGERRPDPVRGFTASMPAAELAESRVGLHPPAYVGRAAAFTEIDDRRVHRALAERSTSLTVLQDRTRATDSVRGELNVARSAALRPTTIAETCDVRSGPGRFDDVPGSPSVPMVLPRSIRHNRIVADTGTVAAGSAQARHYRLETGDIVGIRVGRLGSYGVVRSHQSGWLLGPGCLRIRPGRDIDPGYLAYLLGTTAAQDWLDRHATGSAVRGISASMLGDMPLLLPDPAEQRRISAVLAALDDEVEALERAADASVGVREAALEVLMADPAVRRPGGT